MGQTQQRRSDSDSDEEYEISEMDLRDIKVVFLGDDGVGKTSLLIRYHQNKFTTKYLPNIFDNKVGKVRYHDQMIGINSWDTSGNEEYDVLRPLVYQETDVFVLCFDVTNPSSFKNAKLKWYNEATEYSSIAKLILCGTKSDLRCDSEKLMELKKKGEKPIEECEAEKVNKELKCFCYIETSSRNSQNVNELMIACLNSCFTTGKKRRKERRIAKK